MDSSLPPPPPLHLPLLIISQVSHLPDFSSLGQGSTPHPWQKSDLHGHLITTATEMRMCSRHGPGGLPGWCQPKAPCMVVCLAQGQPCKFLPRRNEVPIQGNPQVEAPALGPFSCPSPSAAFWQGGGLLCCLQHPCLLPMGEGQWPSMRRSLSWVLRGTRRHPLPLFPWMRLVH